MASSSSPRNNNEHDVFLSFRGEDTRDNFTSHLYSALCQKSIATFIDNDLKRGDEISRSLLDTIEASSISIVIFSKRHASSGWCLDELLKILECKHNYGQIVIPVFYRVDPSHVRKRIGSFGDSISMLEERFPDKMQRWRSALTEVANLSGFNSHVIRPESKLIEEIVSEVLERLDDTFETENKLVGVDSRIEEILSLLGVGLTMDTCKLGIWGIGGVGKTAIAEYNKIRMHDLMRNMGREIVRQESINDPSKRSRLWHHKEIYEVLTENMGTEEIEGICLDMSKVEEIHLYSDTFTKMRKLRFLKFYNSSINGENKCKVSNIQDPVFPEIRYLFWHGYPLKSLPSITHPAKLVLLEVPHSNIQQLGDGGQRSYLLVIWKR